MYCLNTQNTAFVSKHISPTRPCYVRLTTLFIFRIVQRQIFFSSVIISAHCVRVCVRAQEAKKIAEIFFSTLYTSDACICMCIEKERREKSAYAWPRM